MQLVKDFLYLAVFQSDGGSKASVVVERSCFLVFARYRNQGRDGEMS